MTSGLNFNNQGCLNLVKQIFRKCCTAFFRTKLERDQINIFLISGGGGGGGGGETHFQEGQMLPKFSCVSVSSTHTHLQILQLSVSISRLSIGHVLQFLQLGQLRPEVPHRQRGTCHKVPTGTQGRLVLPGQAGVMAAAQVRELGSGNQWPGW